MVVKVLGPLDTGSASLGPRERTVLAALIVRRTTSMSPPELAEAWWGETLPPTWAQQVRNSVARIRARLGRDAILTEAADYRLGIDADAIDAVRFERLVSDARGLALRGEHDRSVDGYRKALALWRGEPLQDVADWEPGVVEAMRLGEIRTSAQEELLDERLRAGEHRALIPEAERLVREDPLREDRWAILALANYRADRQAEALATLRAARSRLADELGIEPGARLATLETAMLRRDASVDAPVHASPALSECPYPGLRAFGVDDAEFFFGRERDADAVIERCRPGAVVAVAGPSGSGKSSLILAGVLPRLAESGRQSRVVPPTASAAGELRVAGEVAAIVVIDQAEELVALAPETREDIFGGLDALRADGKTILLTVRSDALDALRASALLGDAIGQGVYLLGPLDATSCREVIEEPARRAGLRLEPGLVELAIRDCGDRVSTLPHLSHALRETWHRREGLTLTVAGYEEAGGIAGGIALSAESVFQSLTSDQQELCRSLMRRLIDRGADGIATRRRVPLGAISSDSARRDVLERLVQVRLLSVDGEVVMVTHEAIASAWPRLDGWLDEDAERARLLRIVETAATEWDAGGRNDEDLLRGARLTGVVTWREASDRDLTDIETGFLDASAANAEAELRELEQRAAHERSRNRVLRGLAIGAAALLVAAVATGGVAVIQGREAAVSAEDQRIEALVATSLSLRSTDLDAAALLAAEAYQRWPNDGRVRSSLWGVLNSAHGLLSKWRFDGAKVAAAVIPGTSTALLVVQGTGDAETAIVDLDTAETLRTLEVDLPFGDFGNNRQIAVSADGSTAVVQTPVLKDPDDPETCCANHLQFIDLGTGEALPGSGVAAVRTTSAILMEPDGSAAFLGNLVTTDLMRVDSRTGAITASDPRALEDLTGENWRTNAIAWAGEGRIAVGDEAGVTVFDAATLAPLVHHAIPGDRTTLTMTSAGDVLVTSGPNGIALMDVASGTVEWTAAWPVGGECSSLAVDVDRGTIQCGQSGQVTPLSMSTGSAAGPPVTLQTDEPPVLTLHGDGDELLMVDSTTIFRSRVDGSGPMSRLIAAGRDLAAGFGGNGSLIVTGGRDGDGMQVWDVARDLGVGAPAHFLRWLSDDLIFRADDSGESITRFDGSAPVEYPPDAARGMGSDLGITAAPPGDTAYLLGARSVQGFDPLTGEASGKPLHRPSMEPWDLRSVSESTDGAFVAVTWWDHKAQLHQTTVFERATGAVMAEGVYGSEGSLVTAEGDLVVVSDTALTRNDLTTLKPLASLPKPFGGGHTIEMDDAAQTMLVVGWDNRGSLYDMADGIRLGDPLQTVSPERSGGAHLSQDGAHLVTGAPEGVLVWDMSPAAHAISMCRIAGRELTPVEWSTYFGDEPQTATCGGVVG
jgi:DNA-binding SARP family transcriptional activator/energy-coupling factor transporter ATP-binding protein EcfA2